jgi:septal ring factor EnvC (AmiA/AmiB activator)
MLPNNVLRFVEQMRSAHDELCELVNSDPEFAKRISANWTMEQQHNLFASFVNAFDSISKDNDDELNAARSESSAWKREYADQYTQRIELSETLKSVSAALAESTEDNKELKVRIAHLESHVAQLIAEQAADIDEARKLAQRASAMHGALNTLGTLARFAIDSIPSHHITSIIEDAMNQRITCDESTKQPEVLHHKGNPNRAGLSKP